MCLYSVLPGFRAWPIRGSGTVRIILRFICTTINKFISKKKYFIVYIGFVWLRKRAVADSCVKVKELALTITASQKRSMDGRNYIKNILSQRADSQLRYIQFEMCAPELKCSN
jgi:hypothetical protein